MPVNPRHNRVTLKLRQAPVIKRASSAVESSRHIDSATVPSLPRAETMHGDSGFDHHNGTPLGRELPLELMRKPAWNQAPVLPTKRPPDEPQKSLANRCHI